MSVTYQSETDQENQPVFPHGICEREFTTQGTGGTAEETSVGHAASGRPTWGRGTREGSREARNKEGLCCPDGA